MILLKSVTIPPDMDWTEASRRGYVDGYFPTMVARGVKVRAVNLRECAICSLAEEWWDN